MSAPARNTRSQTLARQLIYVALVVAIAVPLVLRARMKVTPGPRVKSLYDRVEALKPGAPVIVSLDFDPASLAELKPMSVAVLRHCFQKKLRPIVMTHWVSGLSLVRTIVEDVAKDVERETGKPVRSGHEYAFLGYKPGMGSLLLNMGERLKEAFDKDYYGENTDGMPVLEGVNSLKDMKLGVAFAAGATTEMWIAFGRDRFGFPLGAGCTGVIAPDLYPYLDSGQLCGLLGGLRGAAEYEVLIQRPGGGMTGMASQSAAHVLIIALILATNIHFLLHRRKAASKG